MSTLAPGLYRATVRGVPGESIVMVGDDGNSTFSLDGEGNVRRCYVFTDARPLIVLDLGDWSPNRPHTASEALRESSLFRTGNGDYLSDILNQIERQLPPARIPEPGLWGVVEARTSALGASMLVRTSGLWMDADTGSSWGWDELIDPVLVRDGIES